MKSPNKKLLIVVPYFFPSLGGVENYTLNIAKGLKEKYGWEIVVVTSEDKSNPINQDDLGFKIYRLPVFIRLSNTPINPLWYFQIKKIISDEKPTIINCHSPVPFIADITALVCKNTPIILTYHAGNMKKGRLLADLFITIYENIFLKLLINKSKQIICSSDFVKKTMFNKYKFKATTITPGVDTLKFNPNENIKRDLNSILFIARHSNMYQMKGLFVLLEAMKKLPNVHLNVIGEKLNLNLPNVTFLGIKENLELITEIQKAGILILPSLNNVESFGMVLIEAMACKTPVIGTNTGGIPGVISHGKDGFLVGVGTRSDLIDAINKIIGNKDLISKMGDAGYEKVKYKFNWDLKVKYTNKLFQKYL